MHVGVHVVWVCACLLQLIACSDDETTSGAGGDAGGGGEGAASSSSTGAGGSGGLGTGGVGGSGGEGGGSGGEGGAPIDPCSGFAVSVEEVVYGDGAGFGQDAMPGIVLGPPEGAGDSSGSLDVVSLGNGGTITLGLGDQRIIDGDGPDFIVFENAFYAGGNEEAPFAELATVEVSEDGTNWIAYPCDAVAAPYGSCAGWHPVFASSANPSIDPKDPEAAGGDAFDLADVGVTSARFIRIIDRADIVGLNGAFDLDAIALINATCE